jgi:hypothetical protein
MTPQKRILLITASAVVAVAALSLALLFNATLRATLLGPLFRTWLSLREAFAILSERMQWTAILGIAFFVILQMIFSRAPEPVEVRSRRVGPRFVSLGTTERLDRMLAHSHRSRFAREQILVELRDLAARIVAGHHGLPYGEAKSLVDNGTWTDDARSCRLLLVDPHKRSSRHGRDFLQHVQHVLSQIEHMHQEV